MISGAGSVQLQVAEKKSVTISPKLASELLNLGAVEDYSGPGENYVSEAATVGGRYSCSDVRQFGEG